MVSVTKNKILSQDQLLIQDSRLKAKIQRFKILSQVQLLIQDSKSRPALDSRFKIIINQPTDQIIMQELKCEYRRCAETRSAEDLGTALRLLEMLESSTHMVKEEVKKDEKKDEKKKDEKKK